MSATTCSQLTARIAAIHRDQQANFLEIFNFLTARVRRLESDLVSARRATDRALACICLARSQFTASPQ
jgi:hypothetical protein